MPRVKHSPASRARHKKMLARAKGYRQRRSKIFRRAKEFVEKGLSYQFRDLRRRKRDFRSLWIARISAACRANGLSYSVFIAALKKADIGLNRKSLAEIAYHHPKVFAELASNMGGKGG